MLRVQPPGSTEENLGCAEGAQQMIGKTLPQVAWLSPGNRLLLLLKFLMKGCPLPTLPITRCPEAYSGGI